MTKGEVTMERMKLGSWEAFDVWAFGMYNQCLKSNRYKILSNKKDFVLMMDTKRADRFGWAKKMPNDQWDEKIGVGIAYARLKGIPIPKVVEYKMIAINQLVNGDKFYTGVFLNLKEYCFIGYDYVNNFYIAVESETGIQRRFCPSDGGPYFIEKEN